MENPYIIADGCQVFQFINKLPEDTEITVGENAKLDLYVLEDGTAQLLNRKNNLVVNIGKDSEVTIGIFSLRCEEVLHKVSVFLNGSGAKVKLIGLAIADQEQQIDNVTYIKHSVPGCSSLELFKYILNDSAHASFDGLIYVGSGSVKTDAHQTVRALCLSPDSRMQARPELEIYADDVKCSHGATVGQLDQAALYYMRTRGIPENEARLLLLSAFMSDVIENISQEEFRETVRIRVEQRLKHKL